MNRWTRPRRLAGRAALAGLTVALAAGCASANKTTSSAASGSASSSGSSMPGMSMGGSSSSAKSSPTAAASAEAAAVPSVDGIKPIPSQNLATAHWQGMKISAMAMTAVPFVVYDGTTERMVKPTKSTTFHLMVNLNDARTNVPIPYASVWATIKQGSKLVYDERLWPMISEYMGPHYGNDVQLPGKGTYQLSLLVSPPVSARHVEYQGVWLHPHRITDSFTWGGA
jgi:uncharacterized protein involved in high-affinity Fe2+ transport